LEKLANTLATDNEPARRSEAARALGDLGAPDAVAPLKLALGDPAAAVRLSAALALQALGAAIPAEVVPVLAPLVKDANAGTRGAAVRQLLAMGFGHDAARPVLLDALSQGEPGVRLDVLSGLWKSGMRGNEAWAGEALSRVIALASGDNDPRVRRIAIVGMRSLRPVPTAIGEALLELLADAEVASLAAGTINSIDDAALGQAAVARLSNRLQTGATPQGRAAAAALLADLIGWREISIPVLSRSLAGDRASEVRAGAAQALGALRAEETLAPLLKAVKADASPKVRAAACLALPDLTRQALQKSGRLDAVMAVLDVAGKDVDAEVRAAAASAARSLQD
jgi:HEAT repeat protein